MRRSACTAGRRLRHRIVGCRATARGRSRMRPRRLRLARGDRGCRCPVPMAPAPPKLLLNEVIAPSHGRAAAAHLVHDADGTCCYAACANSRRESPVAALTGRIADAAGRRQPSVPPRQGLLPETPPAKGAAARLQDRRRFRQLRAHDQRRRVPRPLPVIFIWTVVLPAHGAVLTAMGMATGGGAGVNRESPAAALPHACCSCRMPVPGFISILVFKGLFNQNFGEINAILNALFRRPPGLVCRPVAGQGDDPDRQHLAGLSLRHDPGRPDRRSRPTCTRPRARRPAPWTNFRPHHRAADHQAARPAGPPSSPSTSTTSWSSPHTDGRPDHLNTKLPPAPPTSW